ncbi:MAG: hypothetical protein MR283_03225, partial [Erysipelotrichaceae bacterium]|nr:hypothetical protein [Erysipelotrichaceae bacterium]
DDVYSGGTPEEADELNLPLLSTAISGGLFHPNCKHHLSTYYPGMDNDDDGDPRQTYENPPGTQEHHYLQHQIQRERRLQVGSLSEDKIREHADKEQQLIGLDEKYVKQAETYLNLNEPADNFRSIKDEFIEKSNPNIGELSFNKNIVKGRFKEEITVGEIYFKNFGGNVKLLNKDLYKGSSPDYAIDNLLWELKTPESHKNFHKLIEKGIKQINAGTLDLQPGGIILDIKKIKEQISIEEIKQIALKRIAFKSPTDMKFIIIDDDEIIEIYQFTK